MYLMIRKEEQMIFIELIIIAVKNCKLIITILYKEGFDYRILVIDGKFVAAAFREPAFVVGNGENTIIELIEEVNKDPERGIGHEKNLTKIDIDYMTESLLEDQQLNLNSILSKGEKIYIKSTANISAGATATDVSDTVHPLNRLMAERISRIIGLNVMGIDISLTIWKIPSTQILLLCSK